MDLSRFFLIILARRKLILFTLMVTISTTLLVSLLLPKSYKSTATLVLTHKGADPVTGMVLPAQLITSYMATQIDVIKSSKTALMVVDQLKLDQSEAIREAYEESNSDMELRDWLAGALLSKLDIDTSRDSSVIGIGFKSSDPEFASIVANAFANAYQENKTLNEVVLPGAQEAFDAARIGYNAGKFGYLEVLDAQRTLFDARKQAIQTMLDYYHELAIIDRIGTGDAFTGALIFALLRGDAPQMAVDFATAACAWKHSIPGDWNRVTVAELQTLAAGPVRSAVLR